MILDKNTFNAQWDEYTISNFDNNCFAVNTFSKSYTDFYKFKNDILLFYKYDFDLLVKIKAILFFFQKSSRFIKYYHFGIDYKTNRSKFFFTIAGIGQQLTNEYLYIISKVLGINQVYCLDAECIDIGCIGFDVCDGCIGVKIYERIKKESLFSLLPKGLDYNTIYEGILLKTFGINLYDDRKTRLKKYIRFGENNYPSIDCFQEYFNIDLLRKFVNDNKLLGLVIDFSIEGEEKKLYFK